MLLAAVLVGIASGRNVLSRGSLALFIRIWISGHGRFPARQWIVPHNDRAPGVVPRPPTSPNAVVEPSFAIDPALPLSQRGKNGALQVVFLRFVVALALLERATNQLQPLAAFAILGLLSNENGPSAWSR
jgi:hypothetical protein